MFLLSYEFVWNNLLVKNKFTKNSPEIHQEKSQLNLKEYSEVTDTYSANLLNVLLRNKHRKLL